jgi:hypothetical protein
MENKLLGEEAVINAYNNINTKNLSYIIIRPGILFDAKGVGSNNIELNQGDTISGEINREDLADCIIAATLSKTITNNVGEFSISDSSHLNDDESKALAAKLIRWT